MLKMSKTRKIFFWILFLGSILSKGTVPAADMGRGFFGCRNCSHEAHVTLFRLNWCNLRNHRTQHWENIQISRSIKNMDVLSFRILWFLKYLHYGWNIQFHWGWIDHFQLWISFWTPECSLRLCYNEVTLPFWCVLRNHRILNDGTSRFCTQIQLRAVRPVGYRRR